MAGMVQTKDLVGIVFLEVAFNGRLKVDDAAEGAAPQPMSSKD